MSEKLKIPKELMDWRYDLSVTVHTRRKETEKQVFGNVTSWEYDSLQSHKWKEKYGYAKTEKELVKKIHESWNRPFTHDKHTTVKIKITNIRRSR